MILNFFEQFEERRNESIFNLYLQCKTQHEIATEIGLVKSGISNKLNEINDFIEKWSEITDSEKLNKYAFLVDKLQYCSEFHPLLYNIWNVASISNEYKHFGNFPIEFMENLLYYYTKPFDVVYDPFAGGGVTIDACKKWRVDNC